MLALQAGLSIPTNFFLVTLHTFTMRRALLIRLSMHTNLLTRPSVELDSPVVLFRDAEQTGNQDTKEHQRDDTFLSFPLIP